MRQYRCKSLIAGIVAILFFNLSGFAQGVVTKGARVGEWTMDYEAALSLAAEKQLPLLLNFTGSDWCVWCKLMQRQVFSQPAWKRFARNKMVLVTLDFPRNQNLVPDQYRKRNYRLQQQFEVSGYPTYVILDDDGQTVLAMLGAGRDKTAESFVEEVKGVLRFRDEAIAQKVESLPPQKGRLYRETITQLKKTLVELNEWLSTRPERNEVNQKKYDRYLAEIASAEEKLKSFE